MPTPFSPFMSSSNTTASRAGAALPQSPNSQLTMNLINNLMQMQGLENSIVQQQQVVSATSSTSSSQTQSVNPANANSSTNAGYSSQMLLEQQIKLSQLQQLQQLQNQIFQQQVCFA